MIKKDSLVFIEHISENIANIELFMKDVSKHSFLKNKEKQNAVIRSIEILGEAVKNLSNSFREKHPSIPWKDIVGMRDKLIHHYFGVDLNAVWKFVKEDLPKLKKQIEKIKKDLEMLTKKN